ncbi:MAG: DUF5110 domain-containing protein, partial [Caldithrix sp.]|nr:DUF5110 domain-containing protein [Caldithrix sp.]
MPKMFNKHISMYLTPSDLTRSVFVFLLLPVMIFASGDVSEIRIEDDQLILYSAMDRVVFKAISENVLMVNYQPDAQEDANTLVTCDTSHTPYPAMIDTTGDPLRMQTSWFQIEINRSPMRFYIYASDGQLLIHETDDEGLTTEGVHLQSYASGYYGITNRNQGTLTTNNGAAIEAGSQGGAGAPFLWTLSGWGLLTDTNGGHIDISNNRIEYTQGNATSKSDVELYFLLGSPRAIFKGMTRVSGKPPLPPRYTLGFMNTEWGIDEQELRNDMQKYRNNDIPIDAYILDFDWMAWGEDNYGEFRWGDKFPSAPGGQLKETIDSLGIRLMGIRKPRIHTGTTQGNYAESQDFFVDYTTDYFSGKEVGRLDFRKEAVRTWFWDTFITQGHAYQNGITGYWNDEADVYGGNFMFMQMQRSQYEGQRRYNDKRVWSINRNFYLGAQRYGYAMWSGDIGTGFASMAEQRLFMLTSINLGAPWWGMDIGGFHGTPSPENYFRWIQFGTFVPVFRVHGTRYEEREPWNYGAEAQAIAKRYIRLRYHLLPYIYSAARQTHLAGTPMVRPLVFAYPDDLSSVNRYSEWMFGDDLLVHPIVNQGQASARIYFPPGQWIDYFNGDMYLGPGFADYEVRRQDIPLFVRAGAIIPAANVGSNADDPAVDSCIILKCFGRGAQSTQLYEDDGITYDYENGIFATTTVHHERNTEQALLTIDAREGTYQPADRDFLAQFQYMKYPDSVYLDHRRLSETTADSIKSYSVTAWAYDAASTIVQVRLPDDQQTHQINVFVDVDQIPPAVDTVAVLSD